MSDWDFLWGLEGEELFDAMSTGMTRDDIAYIQREEERKEALKNLQALRDQGEISEEEFKMREDEILWNIDEFEEDLDYKELKKLKELIDSSQITKKEFGQKFFGSCDYDDEYEYDDYDFKDDYNSIVIMLREENKRRRNQQLEELKTMRNRQKITKEEFKKRKDALFINSDKPDKYDFI